MNRPLRCRWLTLAILAVAAIPLLAACGGSDDSSQSVAATPPTSGAEDGADDSPLGAIRLDLAGRLKTDALKIELKSLKEAGWDGCMGVKEPGKACAELFGAGYIAIFETNGKQYRYHLVGTKWVGPVDPAKADDGSVVPPELAIDFREVLSKYARHDWSLRTKSDPTSLLIEEVLPATADPNAVDALVHVSFPDQKALQWYRVSLSGIATTNPPDSSALPEAAKTAAALELQIRQDMAKRGKGVLEDVALLSYREVTWPNGCLGIEKAGQVCTQALVPGFLVRIGAGGKVYRYHGANGQFTNASLEQGATLTNPGPR